MSKVTKFLTCGSVDDGKSTMIGKLLFDAGLIYEDQLQSLRLENEKNGIGIDEIDYSFLLDGLMSEREQGITIDVAYRYFSINGKKFIVADTPGHSQYTKNMATGASQCEAAIILIDARKGLGLQTRRHTLICALMGINRFVFAVNKCDLVDWSEKIFSEIQTGCTQLIHELSGIGFIGINYKCIPISALLGDNLLLKSENMPWYAGETIYQWLVGLERNKEIPAYAGMTEGEGIPAYAAMTAGDGIPVDAAMTEGEEIPAYAGMTEGEGIPAYAAMTAGDGIPVSPVMTTEMQAKPAKFFVQNVIKSSTKENAFQVVANTNLTNNELKNFRAYAGKLISGQINSGQSIRILSSELKTTIKGIIKGFRYVNSAYENDSISVVLEDEIDISRGDIMVPIAGNYKKHSDFKSTIIWMDSKPLRNFENYIIKGYFGYVNATISKIEYKYNLETFEQLNTENLEINEVGIVHINCHRPLFLESYKESKNTGSFIIIDRLTNLTVGCGMINEVIEKEITKINEVLIQKEKPVIFWFTGLSGSGKTTVSEQLKKTLLEYGVQSVLLDGDVMRKGISSDLGFKESDRKENIRRTSEIAKLILDSGVNVICALISPYEEDRIAARNKLSDYEFIEIFVDTPLEICEQRDSKGYYKKARIREVIDFTGIDSLYERPEFPDITINTDSISTEENVKTIINYILKNRK